MVVILERDRHQQLIADMREAGARIRLITDGDLSAGIAAAVRGTGVHAVMGTGGAPEGVITAAAMRCLGGEIQGRLRALNDKQRRRLDEFGLQDPDRLLHTEDLRRATRSCSPAPASPTASCSRACASSAAARAPTPCSCRARARLIRFVDSIHREDDTTPVFF